MKYNQATARDFKTCMTVKELKEIIKDWPDKDAYGEPTEVWIKTGPTTSSPCGYFSGLNMRTPGDLDGDEWSGDVLLGVRR